MGKPRGASGLGATVGLCCPTGGSLGGPTGFECLGPLKRGNPLGGLGTPLPPTVSEAMELVAPISGGAEAMDM